MNPNDLWMYVFQSRAAHIAALYEPDRSVFWFNLIGRGIPNETKQLLLRCYAERVGDQWQAFCLDLSLAAQGDTFMEVKDNSH